MHEHTRQHVLHESGDVCAVVQAPIGSATTPALAAAVSEAGGLGMLALSWSDLDVVRSHLRATKQLTQRPFGVNLVLQWPQQDRLEICLREQVPVVSTFWGDPAPCHVAPETGDPRRHADVAVQAMRPA
jgi:nitronate monooxygenase